MCTLMSKNTCVTYTHAHAPVPRAPKTRANQNILVDEKTGEWKKLENLVQNWSIGSIVSAQPTAEPLNDRRDNVEGMMTT